ncbi:hypothetical protein BKA65DRAFT_551336 [Rhexocercosporidium sp. MPI-PUGE-AT-0058]|nr:hypothetical protein BKA65DRAFT_551336 [Rhexocercosporidium sp. MPI-PUGE-AT-0058]
MKITNIILHVAFAAIALLASTVVGSPADNSVFKTSPFEGYAIEPLEYSGTFNGVQVNMTGTAEQIFKELSAKDPDFDSQEPRSIETELVTRAKKIPKTWQECLPIPGKPDLNEADTEAISHGIGYLRKIGGTCGVGVRTCARVSCSWNSAIFLCNDNPNHLDVSSNQIADYTQDLVNACDKYVSRWRGHAFGGRIFDNGGWQVVVLREQC